VKGGLHFSFYLQVTPNFILSWTCGWPSVFKWAPEVRFTATLGQGISKPRKEFGVAKIWGIRKLLGGVLSWRGPRKGGPQQKHPQKGAMRGGKKKPANKRGV